MIKLFTQVIFYVLKKNDVGWRFSIEKYVLWTFRKTNFLKFKFSRAFYRVRLFVARQVTVLK